MNDLIIQGIGLLGVISFVVSYQIKSNKGLFACQLAGNGFFIVQFVLLGAYTGCINLALMCTRNFLMMNVEKWKWVERKWWGFVLIGIAAVGLVFTWDGPISLLPFIALTGGTFLYMTNNAQKIRMANLFCCCPAWITYEFFIHSWTGMLNESIMIVSILVSIYRYGWNEMNEKDFGKKYN